MLIKTQSAGFLVNADHVNYFKYQKYRKPTPAFVDGVVAVESEFYYEVSAVFSDRHLSLGDYATEERAKQVIDQIANCQIAGNDIYNMPEK